MQKVAFAAPEFHTGKAAPSVPEIADAGPSFKTCLRIALWRGRVSRNGVLVGFWRPK